MRSSCAARDREYPDTSFHFPNFPLGSARETTQPAAAVALRLLEATRNAAPKTQKGKSAPATGHRLLATHYRPLVRRECASSASRASHISHWEAARETTQP